MPTLAGPCVHWIFLNSVSVSDGGAAGSCSAWSSGSACGACFGAAFDLAAAGAVASNETSNALPSVNERI